MAELSSSERLQPCLLDRLTDFSPDREVEGSSERVVSGRRYREAVIRDLGTLLATARPDLCDDIDEYPEVARSVLNFGLRDLCGSVSAEHKANELARDFREAFEFFEPRLDSSTLKVKPAPPESGSAPGEMAFDIRADLWANPAPEELLIRTRVELETGEYVLTEQKAV